MSDISEGIVVLRNDTEAQGRYESGTISQPGCNSAQREVGVGPATNPRWDVGPILL